eukprot:4548630-Pyramimonas_sp.AAC.1
MSRGLFWPGVETTKNPREIHFVFLSPLRATIHAEIRCSTSARPVLHELWGTPLSSSGEAGWLACSPTK